MLSSRISLNRQTEETHTHARFVVVAKFEFEFGALRREQRRCLDFFYTRTSCLKSRRALYTKRFVFIYVICITTHNKIQSRTTPNFMKHGK